MSIRTTVTLDDDVADRLNRESRMRGSTFRETINDLLRLALLQTENRTMKRKLRILPVRMGYKPGLNHDSVEALIEYGEGERHR